MTLPLWVAAAAEAFWQEAGEPESFPRELRRPLARALPVGLVLLPRLRLRAVDDETITKRGATAWVAVE